jgi:hypothetical protein
MPIFIYAARRIGGGLRDIARDQMRFNAQRNAVMYIDHLRAGTSAVAAD